MCVSAEPLAVGTRQRGVLSLSPVTGSGEVSGSVEASGSSTDGVEEAEGSTFGTGVVSSGTGVVSSGAGVVSSGTVVSSGVVGFSGTVVSGTSVSPVAGGIVPEGWRSVFVPQPASAMHDKYKIKENVKIFFFIAIL